MRNLLKSIIISILILSTTHAKPIIKNKNEKLHIQMKRVNLKAEKLEKETKEMLVALKKLLESKKKNENNFLCKEIK